MKDGEEKRRRRRKDVRETDRVLRMKGGKEVSEWRKKAD